MLSTLERVIAKTRTKKAQRVKIFLLALPFLTLTFIFSYYPLYGWRYAFYDFRPPLRIQDIDFVGLTWFRALWDNPARVSQITNVLRNTFGISGLGILFSWLPIAFALLLQEVKFTSAKKGIQILTTMPFYISWVLIFSLAFAIFATDGMFNNLLISLGVIERRIQFLQSDSYVWATMTAWSLWRGLGWGAIIYIAAIAGIDQELYEAARVDGANRFRLIWHITMPGIIPTYVVLLLLAIANFFNTGFEQFYVFSNPFNMHRIQVLDLYIFRIGIGQQAWSFATAVSILRSIIGIILLFSVNGISKLLRGEYII